MLQAFRLRKMLRDVGIFLGSLPVQLAPGIPASPDMLGPGCGGSEQERGPSQLGSWGPTGTNVPFTVDWELDVLLVIIPKPCRSPTREIFLSPLYRELAGTERLSNFSS